MGKRLRTKCPFTKEGKMVAKQRKWETISTEWWESSLRRKKVGMWLAENCLRRKTISSSVNQCHPDGTIHKVEI
jgi:hypothetical protein